MQNNFVPYKKKPLLIRLIKSLTVDDLKVTFNKLIYLITDYWFDYKYGLDTCSEIELEGLTIKGGKNEAGFWYGPSKVVTLRNVFKYIQTIFPFEQILVDFGCGKGRVLLIALEFNFKKIICVEFAHELCEIALNNIKIYKAKKGFQTLCEVIEEDAANYKINPDENIFFMFNPFGEATLNIVLDHIEASLQAYPRKIIIIYNNSKFSYLIEQRERFKKIQTSIDHYEIFTNHV